MLECFTFEPKESFGSNCYVLKSGSEFCIIDPSVSYDTVKGALGDISKNIRYIILTHCHFDHILALDEWIELSGVLPSMSYLTSENIKSSRTNCYRLFFGVDKFYDGGCNTVKEGDTLPFGDTALYILETPGHTNGSVCIVCEDAVFVGDTLFADGSFGRCDLPSGNKLLLPTSISKILELDCKRIFSGHGRATTTEEAKKYSYM